MASCEKCWNDAYLRARTTGRSQAECYHELLAEREAEGYICTPREQAGQFWDEEKKIDRRFIENENTGR